MTLHELPNRREAGRRLARALAPFAARPDVSVLALPRGGVPVGYEVAHALGAPLDVYVVRKLGVPGYEELAMGAVASGGVRVLNDEVVHQLRIAPGTIDAVAERELIELARRERVYRGDRAQPEIAGRTLIVVDDGLATGTTMQAAMVALATLGPARRIVAAPVAAADACDRLRAEADDVVVLAMPEPFLAVGVWYADFNQTSDEEVRSLLAAARAEHVAAAPER